MVLVVRVCQQLQTCLAIEVWRIMCGWRLTRLIRRQITLLIAWLGPTCHYKYVYRCLSSTTQLSITSSPCFCESVRMGWSPLSKPSPKLCVTMMVLYKVSKQVKRLHQQAFFLMHNDQVVLLLRRAVCTQANGIPPVVSIAIWRKNTPYHVVCTLAGSNILHPCIKASTQSCEHWAVATHLLVYGYDIT